MVRTVFVNSACRMMNMYISFSGSDDNRYVWSLSTIVCVLFHYKSLVGQSCGHRELMLLVLVQYRSLAKISPLQKYDHLPLVPRFSSTRAFYL